jgi:hypothetical protein
MPNITLSLKEYNRNTTKSQYKEISRWLRQCTRIVEPQAISRARQVMSDLMIYGSAVI